MFPRQKSTDCLIIMVAFMDSGLWVWAVCNLPLVAPMGTKSLWIRGNSCLML